MRKKVLTREQFDRLFLEERNTAFAISGINRMDVLQTVLDSLTRAVGEGTTLAEFAENFDDVMGAAGLDPGGAWRSEAIFRTSIQSAYGRGRYEQLVDPDLADDVYGFRYLTVGDDRVRDEHAALEGHVFAKEEAQWMPPLGFACRCSTELVTTGEAAELGITGPLPVPDDARDAISGDFVSPAVSYTYTPDLSGFDPRLVSQYLAERGDRGL